MCTKSEIVAANVVKLQNTQFVAFSISHRIPPPDDFFGICQWLDHKIEFYISENPVDLLPRINKNDQFDLSNRDLTTSVDDRFEFERVPIVEDEEPIYSVASSPGTRTSETSTPLIDSKLQAVPSRAHLDSVKKAITSTASILKASTTVNVGDSDTSPTPVIKLGKAKKKGNGKAKRKERKKTIESKRSLNTNAIATISGQKVLYDRRTWTEEKFNLSKKINFFKLWLTTTNIISEKLRNEMLPFGIYAKNIVNFPKINSYSGIVLKYSLGDLIKDVVVSSSKIASHSGEKIVFNDVQLLFLGSIPLLKIVENLQMNKLVVEIFGPHFEDPANRQNDLPSKEDMITVSRRLVHRSIQTDVHGITSKLALNKNITLSRKSTLKLEKTSIPKKKTTSKTTSGISEIDFDKLQLLGYAEVNCSILAADGFRLESDVNLNQFHSQEEVCVSRALQHFDVPFAHENVHITKKGAIENGRFVHCKSFIQIAVQLSGLPRLASPERVYLFNNLFKRIVVFFREKMAILPILRRIFKLNSHILDYQKLEIPWVPHWFARKMDMKEEAYLTGEHPCLLTGFAIELANVNILMVEGLNDYTFPESVLDVSQLPSRYGRVLFDDQLIFTERLYQDFKPYGGIYLTTSRINMDELFKNKNAVLRCNIPIPAMRAVHKLNRLISCTNLQIATMERLFPSVQDLLSFNAEFGTPYTNEAYINLE